MFKFFLIRGHRDQEHSKYKLEKSPLQQRDNFKKFAHLGLFSCLPFLYGENYSVAYQIHVSNIYDPNIDPHLKLLLLIS